MLSKTSLQIVKALVELARLPEGEWVGVAVIAQRIKAPQNYLGKVLQSLVAAGLVTSQKGFNGGFRLTRSAEDISLYDVIDPIENVSRWEGCFLGQGQCSSRWPCAVHDRWDRVRQSYINFLHKTSLSDLAG